MDSKTGLTIEIPRDFREFTPKFIGSFTMRQCICIVALFIFAVLNKTIQEALGFAVVTYVPMVFPLAVGLFFGWGEQYLGMLPEIYLKMVFVNAVLTPSHRPFRTHTYLVNIEAKAMKQAEMEKNAEGKTKTEKEHEKAMAKRLKNLPPELTAYS